MDLIDQLDMIQQQTFQNFSLLSVDQLNWKPYPSGLGQRHVNQAINVLNHQNFPK